MRRPLLAALALSSATALAFAGAAPAVTVQKPGLVFWKNTYATNLDYGEPGLAISGNGTIYASTPGDNGAEL
ncbi:MAG: hypothetical protein JWO12_2021, partial [Frankiales bacterium]|nr:hypothetical protein [Frankiales bacterium]